MSFIKKSLATATGIVLALAMAAPAFAQTVNAAQTGDQSIDSSSGTSTNNLGYIDASAFQNVSGNVGVNVAAGNGNQQLNIAHVDNNSPSFAFSGEYNQSVTNTDWSDSSSGDNGYAYITDQAFQYADGNVGVNVAAGNINQQQNAAFIVADDRLDTEGITSEQYADYNACDSCGGNVAYVEGHAFDHANGNIGVNVTNGNGNQQINSLTIASTSGSQNTSFEQTQGGNDYGDAYGNEYNDSGNNSADIDLNAFNHVKGNVGVNVSAGNGNQQANRAEILLSDSNGAQSNTIEQEQYGLSANGSDSNTAYLSTNAFQNASGNIGVNVAAGNANQQANSLTVIP